MAPVANRAGNRQTSAPMKTPASQGHMLRIVLTLLTVVAPVSAQGLVYDANTPVEKIAANPDAAAVLNKDLPGLLSDGQYNLFKSMSLKQLQQASDGELQEADVDKAVADLQMLPHPGDTAASATPAH
jgi:hypothetical protein